MVLKHVFTNYGARVVSLMVPDRNGKMEDVVCGFSDINSYTSQSQNYGATVGDTSDVSCMLDIQ